MWPDDRCGRRVWAIAGLLLLLAASASAHTGSVAFWRVTFDASGAARSQILVSIDDVARVAPHLERETGPVPVERLGAFGDAILQHFQVLEGTVAAPARVVDARVVPSGLFDVRVTHQLKADDQRSVVLRATFHLLTDDTHRVIARVERHVEGGLAAPAPAGVQSLVFSVATPQHVLPDVGRASWRHALAPAGSVRAMLLLGVEHIVTGYDHLVFLACLLVPGGTWRSRVAMVSAFTVAHSLTLVLAAMRIVTPPAAFVEPAIAVSIAYVAFENLLGDARRARWPTAFAFGLVHGFGFAGMLDVLDLPVGQWLRAVLAFNIGVEIGQLAIVGLTLPFVVVLARSPWHRRVVQCTSVSSFGLALVWFVQRLP